MNTSVVVASLVAWKDAAFKVIGVDEFVVVIDVRTKGDISHASPFACEIVVYQQGQVAG